jgi:hypothetical protein
MTASVADGRDFRVCCEPSSPAYAHILRPPEPPARRLRTREVATVAATEHQIAGNLVSALPATHQVRMLAPAPSALCRPRSAQRHGAPICTASSETDNQRRRNKTSRTRNAALGGPCVADAQYLGRISSSRLPFAAPARMPDSTPRAQHRHRTGALDAHTRNSGFDAERIGIGRTHSEWPAVSLPADKRHICQVHSRCRRVARCAWAMDGQSRSRDYSRRSEVHGRPPGVTTVLGRCSGLPPSD